MPQAPASLRPRFNLKREAAPVATRRRDPLQLVYGLVSISNEKPPRLPQQCNVSALRLRRVSISNEKPPRLPPRVFASTCQQRFCFNLKREAAPVATLSSAPAAGLWEPFQSQTRSRPGCHSGVDGAASS